MKKSVLAGGVSLLLCAILFLGCGKPAQGTSTGATAGAGAPGISVEDFCTQYEGAWTADNGEFVTFEFAQGTDGGTAYFGWGIWNSDMYYGPGIIEALVLVRADTYDLTVYFPAQPETELYGAVEETTMVIRVRDTDSADDTISVSFDGNQYTEYILDTGVGWGSALDSGWYWDYLCGWEDDCYWSNPDTQDYIWFLANGNERSVVFGNWQNDNNRGLGEVRLISVWPDDNLEVTIYFPAVAADNEAGFWPEEYVYAHIAVDIEQDTIYVFADGWVFGQTYYRAQG